MSAHERDLIVASKAGVHAAFTSLVTPHLARIHALTFRIAGERHAAEDLAQEAILQAFRSIDQFQGQAAFSTWLYRIAVNLSLRHIEKQKQLTFEQWPAVPDGSETLRSSEPSPEERILVGQVREGCLTGLVRCLPRDQRIAFVLNVLVGVSIADAAAVLDCSEEVVKTRVSRARRRLADFVEHRCEWFHAGNRCRCRHFVPYSLQRGLIREAETSDLSQPEITRVEEEIDHIRRVTRLYESLPAPQEPPTLAERIRRGLVGQEWSVLK